MHVTLMFLSESQPFLNDIEFELKRFHIKLGRKLREFPCTLPVLRVPSVSEIPDAK